MQMNMQLSLKKPGKAKAVQPKYVLNLAEYDKKKMGTLRFLILLVIILLVVVAFAKFAVIDRFAALDQARAEADSLKQQIDANYAKIQELQGVTEEYAHYTFSGMDADELSLVSRVDVMDMINRLIIPYASVSSWNLQGNTLNMTIARTTLARVNRIVASINAESIVNYSYVQTAATENSDDSEVTAQLTVYLQIPEGEEVIQTEGEEVTQS